MYNALRRGRRIIHCSCLGPTLVGPRRGRHGDFDKARAALLKEVLMNSANSAALPPVLKIR
jgi:hypothetical protein